MYKNRKSVLKKITSNKYKCCTQHLNSASMPLSLGVHHPMKWMKQTPLPLLVGHDPGLISSSHLSAPFPPVICIWNMSNPHWYSHWDWYFCNLGCYRACLHACLLLTSPLLPEEKSRHCLPPPHPCTTDVNVTDVNNLAPTCTANKINQSQQGGNNLQICGLHLRCTSSKPTLTANKQPCL